MLVIKTAFSLNEITFAELLERVKRAFLGALKHQIPFEKIVSELKVRKDPSRHPVVQVLFVLQNNRYNNHNIYS
jgi:Condensation domain